MRQFVAYHNFNKQGEYDTTRTEFEHFSNGRLSILNNTIGNRLWVIGGRKGAKRTEYSILSHFSPSKILPADNWDYCIKGSGIGFNPGAKLNKEEWWDAFRITMGNFGTGIQELKNPKHIEGLIRLSTALFESNPYPDELPTSKSYPEGSKKLIIVNTYERNIEARRKCIKHFGAICQACFTDMKDHYGVVAEGLIHIHHKVPLSSIGQNYEVDPINDLIPLCPNCHAVVHYGGVTRSVEEVRDLLIANAK